MGITYPTPKAPVYQLISSPAVFRSDKSTFNTVYSILYVKIENGAAKTRLVYDITRIKSVGEKILSEVIKHSPTLSEIDEFISEFL